LIVIRPFTRDDAARGQAITAAALANVHARMASPVHDLTDEVVVRSRDRILHLLETDPDSAWVAEVDGEVAGLVATHLVRRLDDDAPSCRIADIVVAAGSRREGVGTALVEAAEAEARRHGASRLELSSGEWRGDARAFYLRLGFESPSRTFVKRLS
jgi:GNAT superfamily N-acetyltransferase